MKKILPIYLSIILLFFATNCKKKNDEEPEPKSTGQTYDLKSNGNSIQKTTTNVQHLNTIVLNTEISQNEITGVIGDKTVIFYKSGENTLTYITPEDLLAGEHSISFDMDGNTYKTSINIENSIIVSNAQARIDQYKANIEDEINDYSLLLQNLVDSNSITVAEKDADLNELNQFVEDAFTKINSLEENKKLGVATFIEINKAEFENEEMVSSLRIAGEYNSLLLFKASVLTLGGSVWATYICAKAQQYDKALLGLVGTLVSFKAALHFGKKSRADLYKPVAIAIDHITQRRGVPTRLAAIDLEVENEKPKTLALSIKKVSISKADATSSNSILKSFFNGYNDLNDYVSKINQTIEWVNANLTFLPSTKTIGSFPIPDAPGEGVVKYENIGNLSVKVSNNPSVSSSIAAIDENNISLVYNYSGTSTDPVLVNSQITYNDGDFSYTENLSVTINHPLLAIGQSYGGGIIFYLDESKRHGLISALTDQSIGEAGWLGHGHWGCYGTNVPGADGLIIGSGEQNTTDIIANGCAGTNTGPGLCANLVLGGYDDWFLPSKFELDLMYENLHLNGLGNFNTVLGYLSSSEYAGYETENIWGCFFSNGYKGPYVKGSSHCVRAVRSF